MIRDIFDYILSLLKSRIMPLVLFFILMASVLISRLFGLQIVNGKSNASKLSSSIQITTGVPATRGRIFDRNGVLLAYNDLAYAVKISDSGTYENNAVKNEKLNNAIDKVLTIIDEKGDKYSNEFKITMGSNGHYQFNVSGTALLRFLRDTYGAATLSDLKDEQKNATADTVIKFLCDKYGIADNQFGTEHLLEILNLRTTMTANSYNRYLQFTIANEVSDQTVAAILENSDELVGITVEEQYIRRYTNSTYCSQIIGYTGTVSDSELETLKSQNSSYEANDVVGKTGIEQALESDLAGVKGQKTVYVDTVGRVTEVLSETEPKAGNDVYLSIDSNLQKDIYNAIEDELIKILTTYITSGDTRYTYSSSTGEVDKVYIPIKDVYFALMDNGLVSIDKIPSMDTDNARSIYNAFLQKKQETLNWLRGELTTNPTKYGSLSEENQVYVWYVYQLLKDNDILKSDSIDTNNSVYKAWNESNSVSLEDLLKQAISENWIDMSQLTQQQYTSLEETYNALIDYVMTALDTDKAFYKKMYKYMIESGQLSGRSVCMLLYEQGTLTDQGEYDGLNSGRISPYSFMINAITNKIITPGQLALKPCSGSCVMTDPTNGKIIAMVSYPSYDNNRMSGSIDAEYYRQLNENNSKPLLNWATQSQTAPGSTFKMCSSIAGLDSGIISTGTTFYCSGAFTEVTPSPKCWKHSGHGSENVSTAIRDSCNVYFYTVGYKLACSKNGSYDSNYGTSILQKYAEDLGLATKAGIEIDEKTPHASNTNSIASAIGQGNHQYSPLNLARYCTTLATSGKCYNLTLVDKVTDHDGNLIRENQAQVVNTLQLNDSTWNAVHSGMQMAASSYTALKKVKMPLAAKSGTAQEKKTEPDHSLLITYGPYNDPKVACSVVIPNGYTSATSMELTATIYDIYDRDVNGADTTDTTDAANAD